MSEEQLAATEFFGYTANNFCGEVHAICYNEYLACVRTMREKLESMYPDRKEDIERGCTSVLMSFARHLDIDMVRFQQYYEKNFCIPHEVPVYGTDIEDSRGAGERLRELQQRIVAVNHLNRTLLQKVTMLEEEVKKRESLLVKVRELAEKKKDVEHAQRLLDNLKSVVGTLQFDQTQDQ